MQHFQIETIRESKETEHRQVYMHYTNDEVNGIKFIATNKSQRN